MYRANVSIEKPRSGRETAIAEALMGFWGFEDVDTTPDGLVSEAENNLTGGTTEEEFAREVALLVWGANQGFCEVTVNMTFLEELPSESYVFGSQAEYDKWLKSSGDGGSPTS